MSSHEVPWDVHCVGVSEESSPALICNLGLYIYPQVKHVCMCRKLTPLIILRKVEHIASIIKLRFLYSQLFKHCRVMQAFPQSHKGLEDDKILII